MSNDDEVFYFHEEKSTAVTSDDKKRTKESETTAFTGKKSKEPNSVVAKLTKKEKRLIESVADNNRITKCEEIQLKKHSNLANYGKENSSNEAGQKKAETSNFGQVKIQIETCPQFGDGNAKNSAPDLCSLPSEDDTKIRGTRFKHNQTNYNSIESEEENETIKSGERISMRRTGSTKSSKSCKTNSENPTMSSRERKSKISSKNYSVVNRTCEKSKSLEKRDVLEKPNATKKSCSPFKKLSRSSLTIEPDKITVNLSKYSPCASRLAASSKILSSTSPTSPESPLRAVRSRSPSNFANDRLRSREIGIEKATIQASLSLNIHQFQKSNSSTPRSKSVGDSCVTSPTSEGTTTSCSPTGTEILSLDEVGQPSFTSIEERKDSPTRIQLQERDSGEILGNSLGRCTQKTRKTTLETKC